MRRSLLWISTLGLITACQDRPSVQESVAKAMQFHEVKADSEAPVEADTPKGPSPREQLEAQREAELTAAATLPASMPKDLAAACDGLVEAYDEFMKSDPDESEALRWYYEKDRRERLAAQRAGCVRRGSLKAAACASATLDKPLPSLADLDRTDIAARVLLHCASAYPETDRTLARG